MIIEIPDYLLDQTEDAIRNRMLARLPADLDQSEGSYIWDAIAPVAADLAIAAIWVQEMLRRGFASTTFGPYLDMKADEAGLTRREAVTAKGQLQFVGNPLAIIPAGTRISTPADSLSGAEAISFHTTKQAVMGSMGTVTVDIEADVAGVKGNVPMGTISILLDRTAGITSITNPIATTGGLNQEDDPTLLVRILEQRRIPSAGGNVADYMNWANSVVGVGGSAVIPIEDGRSTVSVYVIGADKAPASEAIVDTVQRFIAPVYEIVENEDTGMWGTSSNVVIDDTVTDANNGKALKLVYDGAGPTKVWRGGLVDMLPEAGIWQMRSRIKVDDNTNPANLFEISIWNDSTNSYSKQGTTPDSVDAVLILQSTDFSTGFLDITLDFYWDGSDDISWNIFRIVDDTTTISWVDEVVIQSTFSRKDGGAKAPIGARVSVRPAKAIPIDVSATLVVTTGYDAAQVKAAATESIIGYIKSIAFQPDNDIRYSSIVKAILDTKGVTDYSDLTVNEGTANIPIALKEVAVVGTVTLI